MEQPSAPRRRSARCEFCGELPPVLLHGGVCPAAPTGKERWQAWARDVHAAMFGVVSILEKDTRISILMTAVTAFAVRGGVFFSADCRH